MISSDIPGNSDSTDRENPGAGVKDSIIEIYDKYNIRLRSFLVRYLSSKADVDDVAQEVYLRLIKYWTPGDGTPTLQMLSTIAINIIKDRYNRLKAPGMHPHVPVDEVELTSRAPSPEDILIYQNRVDIIRNVYKGLNKNSRRAFALHRFKGYTYEEIAGEMGISKSMVQKHISNTLLQLRKKLSILK